METEAQQKRARGKGKKPAKAHVNIRLAAEVVDYYRQFPNFTGKMRDVLTEFMRKNSRPPA
jgi:uncharacterized protein (DUF4415 family)